MGENTLDMDCIKKRGWSALWPVSPELAGDGMINSAVAVKPAFVISSREEVGKKGKKHRQRAKIGRLQLTSQEGPDGCSQASRFTGTI
jgi:hypothetical protein